MQHTPVLSQVAKHCELKEFTYMSNQTQSDASEPSGTPLGWQPVERAAELLEELIVEIGNPPGIDHLVQPVPGSQYAADRAVDRILGKELAVRTHDLYMLAVDHAMLATRSMRHMPVTLSLKHRPNSYAGFTCARAALESCSTASWLVDTAEDVGTTERFARFLDLTAENLFLHQIPYRKSQDYQRILGVPFHESERSYGDVIEKVEEHARRLGIEPIRHTKNPRRPVFIERPEATEMADTYFKNGAFQYRFYSAFVHGGTRVTDHHSLVRAEDLQGERLLYQPDRAFWIIGDLRSWLGATAKRIHGYAGRDAEVEVVDQLLRHYDAQIAELKASVESEPLGSETSG